MTDPARVLEYVAGATLVQGTVLAALVALAAVTFLRRARPALLAALWTVVVARFVVPVAPPVRWSPGALIEEGIARLEAEHAATPPAALPPPARSIESAPTASARPHDSPLATALPARWSALARLAPSAPAAAPAPPPRPSHRPLVLLFLALYLSIVALLAARQARRRLRLRRRLRALPHAGDSLRAAVGAVAARLSLHRLPVVRVTGEPISPFVTGCIGPTLVLPRGLDEDPAVRDAVLAHELAHLRRGDPWVHLLATIARTLLFFWPVVFWAARALERAREQACDAWAVAVGPLDARAYARCLVDLARRMKPGDRSLPLLALLATGGSLERRIDMLLRKRRHAPRLGWTALAVALFTALGVGGARSPARAAGVATDAAVEAKIADAAAAWARSCPLASTPDAPCIRVSTVPVAPGECGAGTRTAVDVLPRDAALAAKAQAALKDALAAGEAMTQADLGGDAARWNALRANLDEARFLSLEPGFEAYLAQRFPAGLDLDDTDKTAFAASMKRFTAWFHGMRGQASALKLGYETLIVDAGAPTWSVRSAGRMAAIFDHYADELAHAPVPPLPHHYAKVVDPRDWHDTYCDKMLEVEAPAEANARAVEALAVATARRNGISFVPVLPPPASAP